MKVKLQLDASKSGNFLNNYIAVFTAPDNRNIIDNGNWLIIKFHNNEDANKFGTLLLDEFYDGDTYDIFTIFNILNENVYLNKSKFLTINFN